MNRQAAMQTQRAEKVTPAPSGVLQRAYACGQHTNGGGECEDCKKNREGTLQRTAIDAASVNTVPPIVHEVLRSPGQPLDTATRAFMEPRFGHDLSRVAVQQRPGPAKAVGISPEDYDQDKPSPHQGDASIQCDGSGGFEIVYGGWAGAACGTKTCVTAHESSHVADWQAKWPNGCRGQARGYLPKGDPPDKPLMTVDQYKAFLKESECKAHTVDLECAEALPKPAGCKSTVDDYIKLTREQKANWCPTLSRGAKVALGALGGALVGAGIGALAAGPVGALIGGGIGLVAGGTAGLFL